MTDWKRGVLPDCQENSGRVIIDVVDANDLSPERFQSEYVDRCKPCLIRGAIAHWAALTRWRDIDYLKKTLGTGEVDGVRTTPAMELRWRGKMWGGKFADGICDLERKKLPVEEFLGRIRQLDHLFCYAQRISDKTVFGSLRGDLGRFKFLPNRPAPRNYPRSRVFFFGRSYTDWHFHPKDETLMCQIGASKKVALVGPGQNSWDAFFEVAREEVCLGTADRGRFSKFSEITPRTFVVEDGDAAYIPPYWWHAVETLSDASTFGATLAICWGSPIHIYLDPRFPGRDFHLRHIYSASEREEFMAEVERLWVPLHLTAQTLLKIPD